jgi:DNA-directed RNA polymerase subunit K/omega
MGLTTTNKCKYLILILIASCSEVYCSDSDSIFLDENKKHGKSNSFNNFNNFNLFTYIMTYLKEELTKDIGQFQLTTLLIKRVRELMAGSPALVESDPGDPVKTAFDEFASGKLSITDEVVTKD